MKSKKIGEKDNELSDIDTSKKEIFEELKSAIYHDLEDLVYRMQLTYKEIMVVLDINYFPSERTGYTLSPRIYEIININKTLENLLPDIVKVSTTFVDMRIKPNFETNQILTFTKKSF